MTASELNRDVKRLWVACQAAKGMHDLDKYFKWVEDYVKPEISRLYHADNTLKSLNADNVRRLLRLNLSHKAIALHHFGLHIS